MEEGTSNLLPPKPEEPLDSECCGTGCTPCVFDIYKEKLKRWEDECEKISSGGTSSTGDSNSVLQKTCDIISAYDYRDYFVKEVIEDCLSCKIISFAAANAENGFHFGIKNFPVKLGQHVVLRIQGKSRQYTVLDVRKDGSFAIIFKIYEAGLLTPLVDKLVVGNKVEMRGPFGKEFLYKPNTFSTLTMIAAGTGIAPFCRIIDNILENDIDETKILLLFACRNENEVLLSLKMKEWSRSWNFQVQYFLSTVQDEKKANSLHYGAKVTCGKIDKTVIENLKETNTDSTLYFICGTNSFDKDMLNYLKSSGINEEKIKLF